MRIKRFNSAIETIGLMCAGGLAVDEINTRGWIAAIGVMIAAWGIWVIVDERDGLKAGNG